MVDLERRVRWEHEASREAWWRPTEPNWPFPTHVALGLGTGEAFTDAHWLAQAFREAVSAVHGYGEKEGPNPLHEMVARAAAAGDELAQRALASIKEHTFSEDPDYNCEHPFCVAWWPMVRAAEAHARLDALRDSGTEERA